MYRSAYGTPQSSKDLRNKYGNTYRTEVQQRSRTIVPLRTKRYSEIPFERFLDDHLNASLGVSLEKSLVVCMPGFPDSRVLARRKACIAIVVYSLQHSEGELDPVFVRSGL